MLISTFYLIVKECSSKSVFKDIVKTSTLKSQNIDLKLHFKPVTGPAWIYVYTFKFGSQSVSNQSEESIHIPASSDKIGLVSNYKYQAGRIYNELAINSA